VIIITIIIIITTTTTIIRRRRILGLIIENKYNQPLGAVLSLLRRIAIPYWALTH